MSGVAPKLIMTDEDQSMRIGIEQVFPNTIHRLCMWHILMKLTEKVGATMKNNPDFHERFMSCVWGSETPSEFESQWSSVISDFGLADNIHGCRRSTSHATHGFRHILRRPTLAESCVLHQDLRVRMHSSDTSPIEILR